MIKSFHHKGLEAFFRTGSNAGIQPQHAKRLRLQLAALDGSVGPACMNLPGWQLHPLTGRLAGHWAVSVSGNWRLTLRFDGEDAVLVDYQDYHSEQGMTRMFNPPHPGEVLKDGVFSDGAVTVTDAAAALGVTRVALSRVLNGKAGISAAMAVRLGKWLGTGPETWIAMQGQHDLWKAEQLLKRQVAKIAPLKIAA